MQQPLYDWEFDLLDVYNYRKPGKLDIFVDFIRHNHARMPGDIVEAGVYRGRSLIALGLLLKEIGSSKKIYGFDSFSGFPPIYHRFDEPDMFDVLFVQGKIEKHHVEAAKKHRYWKQNLTSVAPGPTASSISTSGSFAGTNIELIRKKIELLGLDNIELVPGTFADTMDDDRPPTHVMAAIIDCDLYQSYRDVFEFCWPRLEAGGLVYLDEYYSLKFPGARIATDEFLAGKQANLFTSQPVPPGEFERWYVRKEG